MPKPTYKGARDPILKELEAIRKSHRGRLLPEDVVEFAGDPKTALHARFDWDNEHASYLYRLDQARHIIRSVVRVTKFHSKPFRLYWSFMEGRSEDDETSGYVVLDDVLKSPFAREKLLQQALAELEGFMARYKDLEALMGAVQLVYDRFRRSGGGGGKGKRKRKRG